MAEKEDPTRLSAPAAGVEGGQNEQTKMSRQSMSESKLHPIQNKNERKRENTMEPPRPSDLHNAPRGMLDRSLQAQLGRQLRAIFSDVAQEPVPERFIKLLEALEAREKKR